MLGVENLLFHSPFCVERCEKGNVNATLHLLQLAIFSWQVKEIFQSWHITGIVFLNPTATAARNLLSKDTDMEASPYTA